MIGDDKSFVVRTAFATHNSRTVFLIGAVFAAGVLIGQS
jgi:hypothetical protein